MSAGLVHAGELGAIGFVLIVALGRGHPDDRQPLLMALVTLQWIINKLPRRRKKSARLRPRLIERARPRYEATWARTGGRRSCSSRGRIGLDYASLLAVLDATGVQAQPVAGPLGLLRDGGPRLLPITPGGLGIVEASLSGLFVLAGVPRANAVVATLAFRRRLVLVAHDRRWSLLLPLSTTLRTTASKWRNA